MFAQSTVLDRKEKKTGMNWGAIDTKAPTVGEA
jgi:hypothetical protein